MQKVAILYDASQAVLSTFELDEVLLQILGIVRDYFHLQSAAILLIDDQHRLYPRKHYGSSEIEGVDIRLPIGQGITGTAALKKRPVYVPDVAKDPRYIGFTKSTRSELAIPLMVRDEVVGVLDCQSDQLNFFDGETIDLLTLFSTQASIALENARLYSLEQKRRSQLEAINAIARQTTAVLERDELLRKVCTLILQSFPLVDHVVLTLREGESLVVYAHQGKLTPTVEMGNTLPVDQGISGRALATGRAVVINDVTADPAYVQGFVETRSEMCLPLISFGKQLGVVCLESATAGAFEQTDVQPLESVADIIATAIQNANYFDQAKALANVDGLTGAFNRRFFESRITEELERAGRYGKQLAVIMLDIDHFKRLNDEFGHLLGDEVLRQVSALFRSQLRKVDFVCRYGGEEFVLLLPETSGEDALAVAEKVRRVIEAHSFPGVPRPVTISIGVAEFPTHGASRDEIVRAADLALYASKQSGRNRVTPAVAAAAPAAASPAAPAAASAASPTTSDAGVSAAAPTRTAASATHD
ncbi:MAG: diguanylate cyclase [Acidobacteriota bacterium]|nr:diguanylate cyclase [Acidobacteriota bacterium]